MHRRVQNSRVQGASLNIAGFNIPARHIALWTELFPGLFVVASFGGASICAVRILAATRALAVTRALAATRFGKHDIAASVVASFGGGLIRAVEIWYARHRTASEITRVQCRAKLRHGQQPSQTAYYLLPTAYYTLLTTHSSLRTAECLLLTSSLVSDTPAPSTGGSAHTVHVPRGNMSAYCLLGGVDLRTRHCQRCSQSYAASAKA